MNDTPKAEGWVGRSLPRSEDLRLLSGRGRYTDDLKLPGAAHAAVTRAPMAHARIRSIDTSDAAAMPGVLAVWTAADLAAAGLKPISSLSRGVPMAFRNQDGSETADTGVPLLAADTVRYAGEGVAFVVAETRAQALDAAEAVAVAYDDLPAVSDASAATAPDAPQLHADVPGNLAFDWAQGDAAAVAAAFDAAAHVARLQLVNNRIIVSHLEPRACAAEPGPEGHVTLHAGSQSVHRHRMMLAQVLGLDISQVRAVAGDIGGAFGARTFLYPEYAMVAHAARSLGRPVRWTATRSEAFLTDLKGRDHVTDAALALDADGNFTALKVDSLCNLGAHISSLAIFVAIINQARVLTGIYRIPAAHFRLRGALTNSGMVNAYRGVGRAEAIYTIERLIDRAAAETGKDRLELRLRNAVTPAEEPYTNAMGATYDGGDYPETIRRAAAAIDADGFPARRAAALARGRRRGLGYSCFIEGSGGLPREFARLEAAADGQLRLAVGTLSQGQGHETSFRQVAADALGLDPERFALVQGDTDQVATGSGTFASRSMRMAGTAIGFAAERLIAAGTEAAAEMMEVAPADIAYAAGVFSVAGTDRRVTLGEVSAAMAEGRIPGRPAAPLAGEIDYETSGPSYPNGCHACEIEVDPETGARQITRFVAVDDVGRVINPLIVHGQSQGGIAQGVGQALSEHGVHDAEGQLLTGSFMDYAMPRATDLPFIRADNLEILSPVDPIGVKGAGEGGATGAPAAVINALLDALAPEGVTHIDMPATPLAIWQAIQNARG